MLSRTTFVASTATVLWLRDKYEMDIKCIKVTPYQINGQVLLDIEQILPLKEVEDFMVKVVRKKNEVERKEAIKKESEIKELQYEYWTELLSRMSGRSSKIFNNTSPYREYWIASRGYGISGLTFEFVLLKDHTKVQLATTKEIFDKLTEYKAEINENFAGDLSWERLDDGKGKINFLQIERFGKLCEQSVRQWFGKRFDFLGFNSAVVSDCCSERTVIGFDPTFIPKAGKKTHGVGRFWSGSAGAPKPGLEICGIAAIDLDNRTAMHLEAVQTVPKTNESLIAHYAGMLIDRKTKLQT